MSPKWLIASLKFSPIILLLPAKYALHLTVLNFISIRPELYQGFPNIGEKLIETLAAVEKTHQVLHHGSSIRLLSYLKLEISTDKTLTHNG